MEAKKLKIVELPYNFNLRPYQIEKFDAFFKKGIKRHIWINPRRTGKDITSLNLLVIAALRKKAAYLYLLPELNQARRVIWTGIDANSGMSYLDFIPSQVIKGKPHKTHMYIELINGSIIFFGGAENYDAYMGMGAAGIILSEYAIQTPFAWNYLSPMLRQNNGWAIFPYTPRGRNHGYDLYQLNKNNPEWYTQLLTAHNTFDNNGERVITDKMIQAERDSGMPEELIQQEYYCSFDAALVGAYYGQYIEKAEYEDRICNFAIDTTIPVYTYWDIGVGDSTAIWFMQKKGQKMYLIYYYENQGKGIDFYASVLHQIAQQLSIKYIQHVGPFDLNIKEFGTGLTRIEQAKKYGIHFQLAPTKKNGASGQMISLMDGIEAVRATFKDLIFHQDNCIDGLNALRSYRKKYDHKRKVYSDNPNHDWSSHGSDALRYMCLTQKYGVVTPENWRQGYYEM